MRIVELTSENLSDVNKPNQAFEIIGRIIPSLVQNEWRYSEELYILKRKYR